MTTHTSTRRTLSSLAATGLLLITTTAPALAVTPTVNLPEPVGDEPSHYEPTAVADSDIEYLQIGLGALGGLAVTALAVGAANAARHHRPHGHAVA